MTNSIYATAPFDHPKADIILRSSDNVEFRVFTLFLSLASPFFETLFEIPQPRVENKEQEVKDGLAIISVTEDSNTLDVLLRFCYPCTLVDDPQLDVLKDAVDVLEAARKYSLDAIENKVRRAIANPKILEASPLQCFAIALRGHLREETLLAAKHTLAQPLIPSWFQEIELITTTDLLALLTYHKRCGDAVHALQNDLSWITSHYVSCEACIWVSGRRFYHDEYGNRVYGECGCPRLATSRYNLFNVRSPQWWDEFMEEAFAWLQDRPCKATVDAVAKKTVQAVKGLNCTACSASVVEWMREFSDLLVKKVEETVSQIELELQF